MHILPTQNQFPTENGEITKNLNTILVQYSKVKTRPLDELTKPCPKKQTKRFEIVWKSRMQQCRMVGRSKNGKVKSAATQTEEKVESVSNKVSDMNTLVDS